MRSGSLVTKSMILALAAVGVGMGSLWGRFNAAAAPDQGSSSHSATPPKPAVVRQARALSAPSLTMNDYGLSAPPVVAKASARPPSVPTGEQRPTSKDTAPLVLLPPRLVAQGAGLSESPPRELRVELGKFVVFKGRDLKSVVVGDPKIADVVVLSSQLVLVTGKSAGTTQLFIRDATENREHTVIVQDQNRVVATEVEEALRVPGVKVSLIKDTLLLEGDVADEKALQRAEQLAKLFAPNVINLLTVQQQEESLESPALAKQITEALQIEGVTVRVINKSAILSGTVASDEEKTKAEQVAAIYTPNVISLLKRKPLSAEEIQQTIGDENVTVRLVRDWVILEGSVTTEQEKQQAETAAALTGLQVLNRLQLPSTDVADETLAEQIRQTLNLPNIKVTVTKGSVLLTGSVAGEDEMKRATELAKLLSPNVTAALDVEDPPQVRVEVKVLEIARTDLDHFGFEFPPLNSDGGTYVFGEQAVNGPIVRQTPAAATVQAFAQNNNTRLLSSPSTTVRSGKEAKINVGGRIPIPSTTYGSQGTGSGVLQQSVDWQEFGVILTVTPTVDRSGNIALKLQTEVSEPDFSLAVNISVGLVPGFKTRSCDTDVLVRPGELLVIGGLIDRQTRKTVVKFPILGDLPVLGALFRSTRFQEGDTELVILVSPTQVGAAAG